MARSQRLGGKFLKSFPPSGTRFGGKDTMVLSGTEIQRSKVMPNTDE
jgi:hypothetical protein